MNSMDGLFVPLVSPFTDDGSTLSEIRLTRAIRKYQELGAAGFVVCTDAGEFPALSLGERKQILELALRDSQGMPVITNVSALSTSASLDLCQHASRHGARAVCMMPPHYGRYTADEALSHIRTVARFGDLEVFVVEAGIGDDGYRQALRLGVNDLMSTHMAIWPEENPWSAIRIYRQPTTDEFAISEGLVTPLAVFGPRKVVECLSSHHQLIADMVFLLRSGGTARVGRAALNAIGIDMGQGRAPTHALPEHLQDKLRILIEELDAVG